MTAGRTYTRPPSVRFSSSPRHAASASCSSAADRGRLLEVGATLIARHSAHVFHCLDRHVPYDLGDFLDDYAVNTKLRNVLGLLFLIDLAGNRLEAIPLKLELVHMRLADGCDARVGAAPLPQSLRGVRVRGGRRGGPPRR
jgi:hypothetical protein